MTGSLRHAHGARRRPAPARCRQTRRRIGRRLPRRPPLRHVAAARARRARAVPRGKLGERAARRAFTARRSAELANRRAPIKAALLDQRTLAGMGNIYVDEALWRARIHPLRPARELDRASSGPARGDPRALEPGIARQGSTLRDYRLPDGGRADAEGVQGLRPRRRAVRPLRHADREDARRRRGTWFCPTCQRRYV